MPQQEKEKVLDNHFQDPGFIKINLSMQIEAYNLSRLINLTFIIDMNKIKN